MAQLRLNAEDDAHDGAHPATTAEVGLPPSTPPRTAFGLVRSRLVDPFQALEGDKRVGLIIAPAGYGKTTLLSHLAATFADGPVRWLTCQRRDATPAVFLERLTGALTDRLAPGTGAQELMAVLQAGDHAPVLLVVDDAYALGEGESAAILGRLLGPEAPRLSVLVGSRVALPTDLSRLRLGGGIVEFGAEDLRFRAWEVEALLRDIYREPLGPEDVAHLARRTQGWVACLQLFHLATRGKSAAERKAVLGTLNYRSHLVREFLTRNVLDQLPAGLRDFLIQTSVLSRPTGALCDALLEREGSSRDLAELERRQLFTVRLDGEVGYRYHEVLRSYCLAELVEAVGEASVAARFVRAAELLEAAGDGEGAFVAYVSAGDRTGALRLLDQQGDALVGPATSLLDVLPSGWVDSDPWLSLAHARQLVAAGRLEEAAAIYGRTSRHGPPAAAEVAERERRAVTRWLSREPSPVGEGTDWSSLLRSALRADPLGVAVPLSMVPGPAARLAEAVVLALAGRLAAARLALASALSDPQASPWVNAFGHVLSACDRVLFPGSTDRAELVLVVDTVDAPALSRLARAVAGLADESPERSAAAALLAAAARRDSDRWGEAAISALGALGAWRRGQPDAVAVAEASSSSFLSLGAEVPAAWLLVLAAAADPAGDPHRWARAEAAARLARLPEALEVMARLKADQAESVGVIPPAEGGADARAKGFGPTSRSGSSPRVRVRCFGRFEISVGDLPLDLGPLRPRTRALLLVLASHGSGGLHRDRLCDALWPRADASSARRNLQVAASELRQALPRLLQVEGAGGVRRQGESYRLDLGPDASFDVDDFEAAVDRARRQRSGEARLSSLGEAVSIQGAPLLDAEGEVHWIVERRDSLAEAGVWAAVELSRLLLEAADPAGAAAAAERGLRLDRYRDELWRRLIEAADRAGDTAEAARFRHRYQDVLDELGLPGGRSTGNAAS